MIATMHPSPVPSPVHSTHPLVPTTDMPGPTPFPADGGTAAGPSTAQGRGLKGLFAKARPLSPEGPPAPSARTRLRSILGDAAKSTKDAATRRGRKETDVRARHAGRAGGVNDEEKTVVQRDRQRQASPQPRRTAKVAPSMLPAMQKSEDGRWQPPSLSRGSMSTSALAVFADDNEANPHAEGNAPTREPSSRQSLTSLFLDPPVLQTPSTPTTPSRADARRYPPSSSNTRPRSRANSVSPDTPSSSKLMPPPPLPIRARQDASATGPLSKEHYHLRLAASYIVRRLSPIIRGSNFVQGERHMDLRKAADERLTILIRMERSWGIEWLKAASTLEDTTLPLPSLEDNKGSFGPSQARVRAVFVGEGAKTRERKAWVDALKDGILLCMLANDLLPSQPPRIARVGLSDDSPHRAANLTRFISVCQSVDMPQADVFGVNDMLEASEVSLGRVARTVISLIRVAARREGQTPRRAPTPTTPTNKSRGGLPGANHSPSPIKYSRVQSPQRPPITVSPIVERDDPMSGFSPRVILPSVPQAKAPAPPLHHDTPSASRSSTPTPATFKDAEHAFSPDPQRRSLIRTKTAPEETNGPRPSSPTPTITGQLQGVQESPFKDRPRLRARFTTGSRAQVTFSDRQSAQSFNQHEGLPGAPDSAGLHSRERTPSLISAGSRVTSSAYTRSSAALSSSTLGGDDFAVIVDADEGASLSPQSSEGFQRRYTNKLLLDARRRAGEPLTSHDDLPAELQARLSEENESDEAREVALQQSLSALEGIRRLESANPSIRPAVRRGSTFEKELVSTAVGRNSIDGVLGSSFREEENGLAARRGGANPKFYLPKRSLSPSSISMSPPNTAVPDLYPPPLSRGPSNQSLDNMQARPSILDRRRSEGQTSSAGGRASPAFMMHRNLSSVNIPASSPPSLFRTASRASRADPMPILEFIEEGKPTVRYQLGNFIGKGQFGTVYRALNLDTGQMVAIKRIALEGMEDHEIEDVMREVDLLKRLDHPSIVKYEGMLRDADYLNIILEFVENGSLGSVLKAFGKFNERLAASYTAKILEGLDYLHRQGVVHCDLKAANILSTKNGNTKLTDFGVSLNMKAMENIKATFSKAKTKGEKRASMMSGVMGTPNWMAPEVINLNGAEPSSDIWSLGCTVIELVTGRPPYSDVSHPMAVMWRVVEGDPPSPPEGSSAELINFLDKCFEKDPSRRPTPAELFEHTWVRLHNPGIRLRPKDSVPFVRRLSTDFKRPGASDVFYDATDGEPTLKASPMTGALSPHRVSAPAPAKPKPHRYIKTTFASAVPCRLCHQAVKKSGLMCQDCGLVCHPACDKTVSTFCDGSALSRSISHSHIPVPFPVTPAGQAGLAVPPNLSRNGSASGLGMNDVSNRDSRYSDVSGISAVTAASGVTARTKRSTVKFDVATQDETSRGESGKAGKKEGVTVGVAEASVRRGMHRPSRSECRVM